MHASWAALDGVDLKEAFLLRTPMLRMPMRMPLPTRCGRRWMATPTTTLLDGVADGSGDVVDADADAVALAALAAAACGDTDT